MKVPDEVGRAFARLGKCHVHKGVEVYLFKIARKKIFIFLLTFVNSLSIMSIEKIRKAML
jgi:hypothetical protein